MIIAGHIVRSGSRMRNSGHIQHSLRLNSRFLAGEQGTGDSSPYGKVSAKGAGGLSAAWQCAL